MQGDVGVPSARLCAFPGMGLYIYHHIGMEAGLLDLSGGRGYPTIINTNFPFCEISTPGCTMTIIRASNWQIHRHRRGGNKAKAQLTQKLTGVMQTKLKRDQLPV